jgi:hypothetical protein
MNKVTHMNEVTHHEMDIHHSQLACGIAWLMVFIFVILLRRRDF